MLCRDRIGFAGLAGAAAFVMRIEFTDSRLATSAALYDIPVPIVMRDFKTDAGVDHEDDGRFQGCISGAGKKTLYLRLARFR